MNRDDDFDGIPAPACTRRVNGHVCAEPLADDGSCAACATESCETCGAIVASGILTSVTDEGETLRCCPACVGPAVEVAPMSTAEALQWGVEMALGERDDDPSDPIPAGCDPFTDEDETVELAVESMADLVHGARRAEAA